MQPTFFHTDRNHWWRHVLGIYESNSAFKIRQLFSFVFVFSLHELKTNEEKTKIIKKKQIEEKNILSFLIFILIIPFILLYSIDYKCNCFSLKNLYFQKKSFDLWKIHIFEKNIVKKYNLLAYQFTLIKIFSANTLIPIRNFVWNCRH